MMFGRAPSACVTGGPILPPGRPRPHRCTGVCGKLCDSSVTCHQDVIPRAQDPAHPCAFMPSGTMMKLPQRQNLNYPTEHFINREIALLRFQRRVLAQAADHNVPLLERLRFLCIVSSNLDEFFEIRVSGIKEQIRLGARAPGIDGLTPTELLEKVSNEVHALIAQQYELLNDDILPALEAEGVVFLRRGEWTEE